MTAVEYALIAGLIVVALIIGGVMLRNSLVGVYNHVATEFVNAST